jgi:Ca2+/Na+ antiporter
MRVSRYARTTVIIAITLLFVGGVYGNMVVEKIGELMLFLLPWTLLIYLSSKTELKRWEKMVVVFLCSLYVTVLLFSLV